MNSPAPAKKRGIGLGGLILGSAAVMAFLGVWEPSKRDPGLVYADRLAKGLPTVCKGITKHITRTPVIVGERWPPEKCAREERAAVLLVQHELLNCFHREPPQSVFDAATSHAWNFGSSKTCMSSAMQAWNEGDWPLGCRRIQFSDSGRRIWSVVRIGTDANTGKPVYKFIQGLANRRGAERKLCQEGLP